MFLIGTLRTGEQSSERVAELWRRDHLLCIDLRDLRREEIDTLLYLALGGAVEAAAIEAVWNASRGNVLFVRELILGARAAGRFVERQGVWRLTGTLLGTTRLTELVERRLATAPGDASELLVTLALWEPIGLTELERVPGGETLEALENSGLLRVRLDGRRQEVSLAHPLYGEVIRARLTALMRRRVLLEHADRIEGRGARRREDPLRVATARLDAEGSADSRLLLTAARLRGYGHDYPQVQRLARAALAGERTPEALLLLSEALHELGAYAEVEDLLASATDVTKVDEALWVPLVAMRVRNLVWGLQRTAEALGVNRAALDRVDDPAAREELTVDKAMVLTFSGRPVEALDVIRGISGTTNRTVVLRSIAEAPALILTGKCETALQISKRALREHEALEEQLAIAHPGVHHVHQMYALIEAGRLKQAWSLATTAYQVSSGIAVPLGRMWFAYGLGRLALLMGRPQTACAAGSPKPRVCAKTRATTGRTGSFCRCSQCATRTVGTRQVQPPRPTSSTAYRRSRTARRSSNSAGRGRSWRPETCTRPVRCSPQLRRTRPSRATVRWRRGSCTTWRGSVTLHRCGNGSGSWPPSVKVLSCARVRRALARRGGPFAHGVARGRRGLRSHRCEPARGRGGGRRRAGAPEARRGPRSDRDGDRGREARRAVRGSAYARLGHDRRARTLDGARAGSRLAGRATPDEQGDRRPSLPLGSDGQQSPAKDLHEARCDQARGPCRGPARWQGRRTRVDRRLHRHLGREARGRSGSGGGS